METVETFHPQTAALLNITQDHLNRHFTMDNYTRLKLRIFENQLEDDLAVLNYDDPLIRRHAEAIVSQHIWFSRQSKVQNGVCLRDGMITAVKNEQETKICNPAENLIPGPHNLENAMAAASIGIAHGISADIIRQTLMTFAGVEHRIETVRKVHGVTYINDSKGTNVASTLKAVQSMTTPTVILLGGYDKHADFSELATAITKSNSIFHAVLLGETAERIAHDLLHSGFSSFTHADSLGDALKIAMSRAQPGGAVLFSPACASFDMFRDYEHRGRVFKELVNRLARQDQTGA